MVEEGGVDGGSGEAEAEAESAEEWLLQAQKLVPVALEKATEVKVFPGRWKMIVSKLEQLPSRLSDLFSHPCFSKNVLCKEQLQAVLNSLKEAIELAELCVREKFEGKLWIQSDLDSLSGKLDLNLHDCAVLIKTGMLGEATLPLLLSGCSLQQESTDYSNIRELLARLLIGHMEAKHRALDSLVEILKEDDDNVLSVFGRNNVAALVQLLTATSPRIREKTITIICMLVESGSCENWLVSEGVLPPLIRLVESGSAVAKEKAVISLQRLSMPADTARAIVGHGGVRPLIELCKTGDSVSQAAAACALKNISAVPEVRQTLAEEGITRVMISLVDRGILFGSKEYAAECLQNLTASNEALRRSVIAEGGLRCILAHLDGPLPQEYAVGALRNLVSSVSMEVLLSLGFLPRIVHVLKLGSLGAQQAAAAAICRVCSSPDMKKLIGEAKCIPLLIKLLEAKTNSVREVAAQAISSLVTLSQNCRELKRDEKSVPNLVQLLDPSPQNTAKKYAVACLGLLSSSRKCKKLMISYGAIGYLKKLAEMDIPGAKKLVEKLERGTSLQLLTLISSSFSSRASTFKEKKKGEMANKVSNFSDLIQRVTASCLLHPLAAVRQDSGEIAGKNRQGHEASYDSDELEDDEEAGEVEDEWSKEGIRAREVPKGELVGVEKLVEMEILMNEVFDVVSTMKKAYVNLQDAHCPWDPERMRVADVAVVAELRRLGVLRERFRRSLIVHGSGGGRGRRRNGVVGMLKEVVAPYEAAMEELKKEVKSRDVEVENLKEKLKNSMALAKGSSYGGKKGRSQSKRKVSCSFGQVAASPVPELFEATMSQVKEASKAFTSLLLSLMRSAHWDIAAAVRSIESAISESDNTYLDTVATTHHAKFALESYISRKIFHGFDHETFYMDGSLSSLLNPEQFRRDCFTQYRDMKAMDPAELLGILPTCHFGKFCSKKYLSIVHPKMEESLFGDSEQRRQILAGNHPRSQFYAEFLGLSKAVWLLHLLAFSLDPSPSQFEASRGAEFHAQYMESVVKLPCGRATASLTVGFPVSPGFKLGNGSVIKARVFLVSRS